MDIIPLEEAATPVADCIFIQPLVMPERTQGGILLPESAREKQLFARVVKCGPLVDEALRVIRLSGESAVHVPDAEAVSVEAGDLVMVSVYAGHPFEWPGGEYKVVRACDVWAIFDGVALQGWAPKEKTEQVERPVEADVAAEKAAEAPAP